MRQLYKIRAEFLDAVERLQNATTPEEEAEANEALAGIAEDFETKIENIRKVILNLEAEQMEIKAIEDWHKEEASRLKSRRESKSLNVEKLKAYTAREMNHAGIRKVETPFCSAWIHKNPPSVQVFSEEKIPVMFYIPQPPKLDKKQLLTHLQAGNDIEGVVVSQTEGLRFDNRKQENDDE